VIIGVTVSSVNPRVARSANLVFALFAFVFYYNLLSLGQNAIVNGQFSFAQLMLMLHGSIFVVTMLILAKRHHNLQWREMPGLLLRRGASAP
jgi:lipopolysaccharide export system permease protein